jgi:hypothetical protein
MAKAPIAKALIAVAPTAKAPAPQSGSASHESLGASSSAPFLPQCCGIDKEMMPAKHFRGELHRIYLPGTSVNRARG